MKNWQYILDAPNQLILTNNMSENIPGIGRMTKIKQNTQMRRHNYTTVMGWMKSWKSFLPMKLFKSYWSLYDWVLALMLWNINKTPKITVDVSESTFRHRNTWQLGDMNCLCKRSKRNKIQNCDYFSKHRLTHHFPTRTFVSWGCNSSLCSTSVRQLQKEEHKLPIWVRKFLITLRTFGLQQM